MAFGQQASHRAFAGGDAAGEPDPSLPAGPAGPVECCQPRRRPQLLQLKALAVAGGGPLRIETAAPGRPQPLGEARQAAAQPQSQQHRPLQRRGRLGPAQGRGLRSAQQRSQHPGQPRPQRRRPIAQEHGEGGVGHPAVAGGIRKDLGLDGLVEGHQLRQGGGNGRYAHALPHQSPEAEQGLLLLGAEGPPAVAGQPADRFTHKGGEHVEVVAVADREGPVDAVHAGNHGGAGRAAGAVAQQLGHHQAGVVVALAGALLKLARAAEQARDRWHAEGLEQGQLQGTGDVPGEQGAGQVLAGGDGGGVDGAGGCCTGGGRSC